MEPENSKRRYPRRRVRPVTKKQPSPPQSIGRDRVPFGMLSDSGYRQKFGDQPTPPVEDEPYVVGAPLEELQKLIDHLIEWPQRELYRSMLQSEGKDWDGFTFDIMEMDEYSLLRN